MIKIIINKSVSYRKGYKMYHIEGLHKYGIGDYVHIVDGDTTKIAVLEKRDFLCDTAEACSNCVFRDVTKDGERDIVCGYTDKDGWFPCVSFGRSAHGDGVSFVDIESMLENL